jgi:hypothetical protein
MQHRSNTIHKNFMFSQFYLKNWLMSLCMAFLLAISTAFAQIPPYHIAWEKTYGSNTTDGSFYVMSTPEGYCFIGDSGFNLSEEDIGWPISRRRANDISGPYKGIANGWVVWTDKDGNIIDDRLYGGSPSRGLTGLYMGHYQNDQYTFMGSTSSPPSFDVSENGWRQLTSSIPNRDLWVITTDAFGNKIRDKRYGGPGTEFSQYGFARTADGGLVIGANSHMGEESLDCLGGMVSTPCYSNIFPISDGWVIKIGPDGEKLWDKRLGGNNLDNLGYTQVYPNGDILLLGGTTSDAGLDISDTSLSLPWSVARQYFQDAWVVKLDANGNKRWDKRYGGSFEDGLSRFDANAGGGAGGSGGGLHLMPDGGFMLLLISSSGPFDNRKPIDGNKTAFNKGITDYWLVRCDKDGNIRWDKTYGGANEEQPLALIPYLNDKFLLVGTTNSPPGGDRSNGALRDTNVFGTGNTRFGNSKDGWIVCVDTLGNTCWDMIIGGKTTDHIYSAATDPDGCIVFAGYTNSDAGSGDRTAPLKMPNRTDGRPLDLYSLDYWAIKVCPNSPLNLDRFKLQGWLNQQHIQLIASEAPDGKYAIEYTNSHSPNLFLPLDTTQITSNRTPKSISLQRPTPGTWLYRLRNTANNHTSNIVEIQVPEDPQQYDRLTIVPSIAESNGTCTIYYPTSSNSQAAIQLTLFNASGQNLFTTDLDPNQNQYTLDLHAFPPGIYFIQINGNQSIQTEKLVIAR